MDIKRFFEPESIAVIGASRDPNKVGSAVLKNLIITFRGKIFPIHFLVFNCLFNGFFISI